MVRSLPAFVELARRDLRSALWTARAERHTASRAHLLAWAAHFTEGDPRIAIVRESLAACEASPDAFEGVAIAAWPLAALAERGLAAECERAVPAILARSAHIENPVCRLDALERVLAALTTVADARTQVLGALIAACGEARSWKSPRGLRRAAGMLARDAPDAAALALAAIPPGPQRRRAQREIVAGGRPAPRFFG